MAKFDAISAKTGKSKVQLIEEAIARLEKETEEEAQEEEAESTTARLARLEADFQELKAAVSHLLGKTNTMASHELTLTNTAQPSTEILAAWQAIKSHEDIAQALQDFEAKDVKALCQSLGITFHYADAKSRLFIRLGKHFSTQVEKP